jgi:hypothetical protein
LIVNCVQLRPKFGEPLRLFLCHCLCLFFAASVAAGLRGQCVSDVSGRPQAYRPVNETKK